MLNILLLALNILALLVIVATLLPLFQVDEWWVRVCDFPRVQILLIGVAVALGLGIAGVFSDNTSWPYFLVPLIGCLIYQGRRIYVYTTFAPKQALDSEKPRTENLLSLFIANVYMYNRNAKGLLDLVYATSPDVVLLTEPDQWWEKQLQDLESSYPHTMKNPLDNTYGMLLYSRLKLHHEEIRFLIDDSIPSFSTKLELPGGELINFIGLHPRPPRVAQDTGKRDAELILVGREAAHIKGPVVVAGDLNDVAWSYTTSLFQRVSRLVDPRIGRGFYNTFHAEYPFLRFPVDHVFYSSSFRLVEMKRMPYYGSDHFPIFAVLSYEPDQPEEQEPPEKDREDRRKAEQLVRKGKAEEKAEEKEEKEKSN
jgi:endonuclease/exonuclease/phosphatase (EEP) superfamily protein YafD